MATSARGDRSALHRQGGHALTECARASGAASPSPARSCSRGRATGDHLDALIPDSDVRAPRNGMKVRVLADAELRPGDAAEWDSIWREWVNEHAQ